MLFPVLMLACGSDGRQNKENPSAESQPTAPKEEIHDGKVVRVFTLSNASGMKARFTNYGATLMSLEVPDRSGKMTDIVLGYDGPDGYYNGKSYFGCIVGRYANRIAKARFAIDGQAYTLFANNGVNTLHGGLKGFDKVVWDFADSANSITFTYRSPDREEGFPGNLDVTVRYTLNDSNTLQIDYAARTDRATVINLSNHAYFNLAGQGSGDILGHQMQLYCSAYTPVDSALIPSGERLPVASSPFDFRQPHAIGERINGRHEQLTYGRGYDHNFIIDGQAGRLRPAARVTEPGSGRMMEVFTTEPGIQFYSGNFLDGTEKGKGSEYRHRYGFCLETQHFPDSPNQPGFPSTLLKPGEQWTSTTQYVFSVTR